MSGVNITNFLNLLIACIIIGHVEGSTYTQTYYLPIGSAATLIILIGSLCIYCCKRCKRSRTPEVTYDLQDVTVVPVSTGPPTNYLQGGYPTDDTTPSVAPPGYAESEKQYVHYGVQDTVQQTGNPYSETTAPATS